MIKLGSGVDLSDSIVEVLRISNGVVPEGLREVMMRADYKLSELVEDVSPATLAVAAQNSSLLFVHLQISGEGGLSGEDPTASPIPPFPDGTSGVLSH